MSRRPIASIVWRTVVVGCALWAPACKKSSTASPSTPEPVEAADPVETIADAPDAAVVDDPERPRCDRDHEDCPTPDFGFIVS